MTSCNMFRMSLGLIFLHACSYCQGVETVPSRLSIRLEPAPNHVYPPVITAIAVNPTEDVIVAAGDDHAVRLLTGKDYETQRVIGKHSDWVRSLDFSPDGSMLLSAGNDGRIQIWERSRNWENPRELAGGPALACVRFSSSGSRVAAVGFDSEIFLMQLGATPRLSLSCDCRDLRTALFAGKDRILAVGGRSGEIHLFDVNSGHCEATVPLHLGRLRDCTIVRGTNLIASVGEDGRCAIVDMNSMEKVGETIIPNCKLLSIASIDSRHVAVGGSDNIIRIIDVQAGRITKRLVGHQGSVAVLKAQDEHLISGSYDTSIRFWDLEDIQHRETVATVRKSDTSITTSKPSER